MSSENRKAIFTPANLISFVRLAVGVIFFYLLFFGYRLAGIVALALFVLLDILDGYVARKFNCASDLGVLLDHGTDKMFAVVTLFILFLKGALSPVFFTAFVVRDLALSIGWIVVRFKKNRLVSSRFYGKLTGGFYFLMLFLYLLEAFSWMYRVMFLTLFLYYISAFYYAKALVMRGDNGDE